MPGMSEMIELADINSKPAVINILHVFKNTMWKIKKNILKIQTLEVKNRISEMRNTLDAINSGFDINEGKSIKHEEEILPKMKEVK